MKPVQSRTIAESKMTTRRFIIAVIAVLVSLTDEGLCVRNYSFPKNFKFGAATAAYQIEGGWNEDGKGPSIWDTFTHQQPVINNGDVACDSYHKYKEDVEMLKYLNVNYYRFSLSWSRILTAGTLNTINEKGIEYYRDLIRRLKENGIEPMVTLYHWDLPQALEDNGGWFKESILQFFIDYARLAFEFFGDDVKYWITFNEPNSICRGGYGAGMMAPGVHLDGIGDYQCAYVILKAHAAAYHIYDKEFRPTQKGRVSYVADTFWMEPFSTSKEDVEAAERAMQFGYGLYAHPVYHPDGNFPQIVIDRVAERSLKEGFNTSRLPVLAKEVIDYIKGTYDFLALNSYSTNLVKARPKEQEIGTPSFLKDLNVDQFNNASWPTAQNTWAIVPWGLRKLLNWIDRSYGHPEIIITENGLADLSGTLEDEDRINYYKEYLSSVLEAIYEDKVNVTGYTVWSLMDNLEWDAGFTIKFGLYNVDFMSNNRTRTIKKSGEYYKKVITTRCLVDNCV